MYENENKDKVQPSEKIETANDSHKQSCNSTEKIETSSQYHTVASDPHKKIESSREKQNRDISQLLTLYLENH
jgi:hypothetical protein